MTAKRPRAAPTAASLHDAAVAYLARFGATRAGLLRVLQRRIDRYAHEATPVPEPETIAGLRAAAAAEADRLVAVGAIDDAAYAERRGRRLLRAGRSPQAAVAHLRARGVAGEVAVAAVPDDELEAALILARRRRIGPFRAGPADLSRELGILARAGFSRAISQTALAMPAEIAEGRIRDFRAS